MRFLKTVGLDQSFFFSEIRAVALSFDEYEPISEPGGMHDAEGAILMDLDD